MSKRMSECKRRKKYVNGIRVTDNLSVCVCVNSESDDVIHSYTTLHSRSFNINILLLLLYYTLHYITLGWTIFFQTFSASKIQKVQNKGHPMYICMKVLLFYYMYLLLYCCWFWFCFTEQKTLLARHVDCFLSVLQLECYFNKPTHSFCHLCSSLNYMYDRHIYTQHFTAVMYVFLNMSVLKFLMEINV